MAEPSVQGCIHSVFWEALPACFMLRAWKSKSGKLKVPARRLPLLVLTIEHFQSHLIDQLQVVDDG